MVGIVLLYYIYQKYRIRFFCCKISHIQPVNPTSLTWSLRLWGYKADIVETISCWNYTVVILARESLSPWIKYRKTISIRNCFWSLRSSHSTHCFCQNYPLLVALAGGEPHPSPCISAIPVKNIRKLTDWRPLNFKVMLTGR